MKRMLLTTAAIAAVLCFATGVQAADKYFYHTQGSAQAWSSDDASTGYWFTGSSGSGSRTTRPSISDVAHVEAACSLDVTGYCRQFSVSSNVTLELASGGAGHTLQVADRDGDTSTCTGKLLLSASDSVLDVRYSHTINGSMGVQGSSDSATIQVASSKTLTSSTTIQGMLQIAPAPSATSTSFVNGSVIIANGAGTLQVRPHAISGAGTWRVSTDEAAILQFTTGTYCLTGPFDVQTGTLDIVASSGDPGVCTTDTLTQTGGEIYVADGKTFSAGGTCTCSK